MAQGGLPEVDRRALLKSAILLVGGSLAGLPATALAQAAEAQRFFTPQQFAVMDEVAEIIIPRTDTPGARDAGVGPALDALMTNWASEERGAQFRALAEDMDREAGGLLALSPAQRIEAVRAYDAAAFKKDDAVYRRFKELVLTLYYLSEPGATQELRYELVPGSWEASTVMTPDTRAWAV